MLEGYVVTLSEIGGKNGKVMTLKTFPMPMKTIPSIRFNIFN